jgi:hypothetical protein
MIGDEQNCGVDDQWNRVEKNDVVASIHNVMSTSNLSNEKISISSAYFEDHSIRMRITNSIADKIVFTTKTNVWNIFI